MSKWQSEVTSIPLRLISQLFEGVCLTPVILSIVRGEGRLRAAGRYVISAESGGLPGLLDEFQIVQIHCVFTAKVTRVTLQCNAFFTFSYPSRLKRLVLRAFLARHTPKKALQSRRFN